MNVVFTFRIMISAVIPIYNEEKNVSELHRELLAVLEKIGQPFEIIFVNDGSTDRTLAELKKLRPAKIISFTKNFGQTAAFDAGFKAAKGEIIVSLDGDLQNDPADIPRLLKKLNEGYDVVCGWRHNRKDTVSKRFFSLGARMLRRWLLSDSVHDAGCSLRVYRKDAISWLDLYGEMHRFIPSIIALRGFRVSELPVNHRARKFGVTKYNWQRVLKSMTDMISLWFWFRFSNRPVHLFGGVGIVSFFVGFVMTAYFFVARFFFNVSLAGRIVPIAAMFLMVLGVQLFVSGLLADILVKNYYNTSRSKNYFVREEIENS